MWSVRFGPVRSHRVCCFGPGPVKNQYVSHAALQQSCLLNSGHNPELQSDSLALFSYLVRHLRAIDQPLSGGQYLVRAGCTEEAGFYFGQH